MLNTLTALFVATTAHAAPLHVMLDPGHGGVDRGAVRGALQESEIALKVANETAELLRNDPRFRVSMTRTADTKVSLDRRADMAKEVKADLFVSIHLNSSPDSKAHGKEIYFQNQLPADEDALFLASRENDETEPTAQKDDANKSDLKNILEDLDRNHRIFTSSRLSKTLLETWDASPSPLRSTTRAIRQAPFWVVSRTSMPSVLVEIGFISNAHEGPRLAETATQKSIAKSLYDGLVKYRESVVNEPSSATKEVDNPAARL